MERFAKPYIVMMQRFESFTFRQTVFCGVNGISRETAAPPGVEDIMKTVAPGLRVSDIKHNELQQIVNEYIAQPMHDEKGKLIILTPPGLARQLHVTVDILLNWKDGKNGYPLEVVRWAHKGGSYVNNNFSEILIYAFSVMEGRLAEQIGTGEFDAETGRMLMRKYFDYKTEEPAHKQKYKPQEIPKIKTRKDPYAV